MLKSKFWFSSSEMEPDIAQVGEHPREAEAGVGMKGSTETTCC